MNTNIEEGTASVKFSTEEMPLAFGLIQEQAYWTGFAAGAQLFAEHAKRLAAQRAIASRKPAPPTQENPDES